MARNIIQHPKLSCPYKTGTKLANVTLICSTANEWSTKTVKTKLSKYHTQITKYCSMISTHNYKHDETVYHLDIPHNV